MYNKAIEILKDHTLFKDLRTECYDILESGAKIKKYNKDDYIFYENGICKNIYILLKGTIVITKRRGSKDVINRIVFENGLFCIESALEYGKRSKGAKAVGGSADVLVIPKKLIEKLIEMDAVFSQRILLELIKNLKRMEKRLDGFVFKDAKERIIDFIKDNAKQSGVKIGYETLIKHSFTQQNIADYTGTSRQTVTTILKELKKGNKISFQRKRILVRNLAEL